MVYNPTTEMHLTEGECTAFDLPSDGTVHVWLIRLVDELADYRLLDETELQRASRFHFPIHRRRFIAARVSLRRLLGWWLGIRPERVAFGYSDRGKPSIVGDTVHQFNISHSEDLAALALSYATPVGVDIERIRGLRDLDAMSRTVFNARERARLNTREGAIQPRDFFIGWTRKEAYLKAIGSGLSVKLHAVTVDMREESPRLLSIEGSDEAARWSLRNLFPQVDFVGAVAVCRPDVTLHLHERLPE